MSADIEGHITEKYEIKKRLGKGVNTQKINHNIIVDVFGCVPIAELKQ